MVFGPREEKVQCEAACAEGKRRWLCWLNPVHALRSAPVALRLALIALSVGGMCAALVLWMLGRPYLAVRVLAGDVAVGTLILLAL